MIGSTGMQGPQRRISAGDVSSASTVHNHPCQCLFRHHRHHHHAGWIPVPLRPCTVPGCAQFAGPRGKCLVHAQQAEQHRGTARERGYSRTWEAKARAFKDKYPLCGHRPNGVPPVMSQCYDQGRITLAYQVDHVVPHRGNQALFWDEEHNWQSLCAACGSRKSKAGL